LVLLGLHNVLDVSEDPISLWQIVMRHPPAIAGTLFFSMRTVKAHPKTVKFGMSVNHKDPYAHFVNAYQKAMGHMFVIPGFPWLYTMNAKSPSLVWEKLGVKDGDKKFISQFPAIWYESKTPDEFISDMLLPQLQGSGRSYEPLHSSFYPEYLVDDVYSENVVPNEVDGGAGGVKHVLAGGINNEDDTTDILTGQFF